MKQIKIINITYDGYERFYKFLINDKNIMWAHSLDTNQYIEDFKKYIPFKEATASFKIEYVSEINFLSQKGTLLTVQKKNDSTEIKCIGIIKEIIDDYSFICYLDVLGETKIKMEKPFNLLKVDSIISFEGELYINIIS